VSTAAALHGFAEKMFSGSEIPLNYAEGPANGPPLLLLHGLTRDWRSFSVLIPELSSRFQVFALDLRGHGQSGHVAGAYRISQFARDIIEFVNLQLPEGTAIFGHSLGAMAAMKVAASGECRVKALILGDTMITPESFRRSLYAPLFRQLHALLLRPGNSQQTLASAMGTIAIPVPGFEEPIPIEELPGNTPRVLSEWARCAQRTDPDAIAMTIDGRAFDSWDPEQTLPQISCPTLLLQGNPELDALLSDADVKLALRLLPELNTLSFHYLGTHCSCIKRSQCWMP